MKAFQKWMIFLTILASVFNADAADILQSYSDDPFSNIYLDDRGGSVQNQGNNNTIYLNYLNIDQSFFGTLLLYSQAGSESWVENGFDYSFSGGDFINGSGIEKYDLAATLPLTNAPGEIGIADDQELLPVSFEGSQSGLQVQQVSYTSFDPDHLFVILEYRVFNPTAGTKEVEIALANDLAVQQGDIDVRAGFDNAVLPLVYQQEGPPIDEHYTTVGVALIQSENTAYRIETCPFLACPILLDDGDQTRREFFQGVPAAQGDLTQGESNQDFAVTISTELGSIPPDQGASAVFCYLVGIGNTATAGLQSVRQRAQACLDFYQQEIKNCGNQMINYGETCDDANDNLNDSCPDGENGSCQIASCGDGFLWNQDGGDEVCDDGNANTHDSCPSGPDGHCQDALCGDGYVWNQDGGTEQCDQGPANSDVLPDACRTNCQNPSCGDQVVDSGEACDDGDGNDQDACPSSCQAATCGDGFLWNQDGGTEQCDDGAQNSDTIPNACRSNCEPAYCGDGVKDAGEACDDGNDDDSDGCRSNCQLAVCGDGIVHKGVEVCDDGNQVSNDGCAANCQVFETCGNGVLDAGEACDDGNINQNDDCPSGLKGICQPASCGDFYVHNEGSGTEQCDGSDDCQADCRFLPNAGGNGPDDSNPVCGNGFVEGDEECDDGNLTNGDNCSDSCRWELVIQGGGTSSENSEPGGGGCQLNSRSTHWVSIGFFLPALMLLWHRRRLRAAR